MLGRVATAIGVLLLVGCAHDPLVVANVYPGLVPERAPQGPLTPVLFSAAGTPAHQGFLYIAMYDAAVAAQNASLAQASTRLEEVKTRVGEVVYAIDPEAAPAWPAKATGIVEVWAGSGYGMRPAVRRMNEEIMAALEQPSASDALRTHGPGAIRCAENALERAERVLALSDQILAAGAEAELKPLLRELDQVATALNNGVPAPGDEGCGLQQTFLYLEQLGPYSPSYRGV